MATFDQIRAVMAQLGERLDCQAVTEYEQRKGWIAVIDDATVVEIAFDDRIGLLHATSPVGDLPQHRRQKLSELLLRYNDQWSSTGGLRVGLGAEGDGLSLTASYATENLESTAFAQQLRSFLRVAGDWRELIAAWPIKGEAEERDEVTAAAAGAFEYLIRI